MLTSTLAQGRPSHRAIPLSPCLASWPLPLICTLWLFNVGLIDTPASKSAWHPWVLRPWICPLTLSIPIFLLLLIGQTEGFSKDPEQCSQSTPLSELAQHLQWFPKWPSKQSLRPVWYISSPSSALKEAQRQTVKSDRAKGLWIPSSPHTHHHPNNSLISC